MGFRLHLPSRRTRCTVRKKGAPFATPHPILSHNGHCVYVAARMRYIAFRYCRFVRSLPGIWLPGTYIGPTRKALGSSIIYSVKIIEYQKYLGVLTFGLPRDVVSLLAYSVSMIISSRGAHVGFPPPHRSPVRGFRRMIFPINLITVEIAPGLSRGYKAGRI